MLIHFENENRAFDSEHPIKGSIYIRSNQAIPAYGIKLTLELKDMSKTRRKSGDSTRTYEMKRVVWDHHDMIYFPN